MERITDLSAYDFTDPSPTTERAVVKRKGGQQKGGKGNVPSVVSRHTNQTIVDPMESDFETELRLLLAEIEGIKNLIPLLNQSVDKVLAMIIGLCRDRGINPDDVDPAAATASTSSVDPLPVTGLPAHDLVPQHTCTHSDVGSEDEEPPQVRPSLILRLAEIDYDTYTPIQEEQGIDDASQTNNDGHNTTDRLADLQGRMDRFEEWKKRVDHRLKDAGL